MRSHLIGTMLVALLTPQVGTAQVYLYPTPPPTVSAAREQWQITGEPIFYKGDFYYPAGPTEFFDGKVMDRTGTYQGIPLYENSTLPPYEIVFVPVGGRLMRPYERRRRGALAGTTGPRTPSFPVEPSSGIAPLIDTDEQYDARDVTDRAAWDWPTPEKPLDQPSLVTVPGRRPSVVPSGPITAVPRRETLNAGAYLTFDGVRYFSSGRAVAPNADRFTRIGGINGSGVFREEQGRPTTIYVESVPGGPLAPYTRR
ncbi:MAG: hypothetical protein AB7N65_26800 [Vicinamibacterales bacterium]